MPGRDGLLRRCLPKGDMYTRTSREHVSIELHYRYPFFRSLSLDL